MGFFDNGNEKQRLANLEALEDKRLRFAELAQKQGFAPEKMLLVSTDRGGVIGLAPGQIVFGPDYGGEGEFTLEEIGAEKLRSEKFYVPGEGMGGIFGMGKKGQLGFVVYADRGGFETEIPLVVNRNSCLLTSKAKNPLLSVKRRRGNANVVWDLPPIERGDLKKLRKIVSELLGITIEE